MWDTLIELIEEYKSSGSLANGSRTRLQSHISRMKYTWKADRAHIDELEAQLNQLNEQIRQFEARIWEETKGTD